MESTQLFLYLYMYELENWLNCHKADLTEISFQSDEANTDRPLKEYIKKIIETKCNGITAFSDVEFIEIDGCVHKVNDELRSTVIEKVLLPDELTDEIKKMLHSRKRSVFTNPDLCFKIITNGQVVYETIELKSTKKDAIPGSSIQQIMPDEWTIFVKHNGQNAEVAIGKYFNAINTRMQFPDRSPRPQVSFSEMKLWNNINRKIINDTVLYNYAEDRNLKHRLLTDWQNVLAEEWVNVLLRSGSIKPKNTPWFYNNLRKFILLFLSEYDEMSQFEKDKFKKDVANLIE